MLKVKVGANIRFYVPSLTKTQQQALARYRLKRRKELALNRFDNWLCQASSA